MMLKFIFVVASGNQIITLSSTNSLQLYFYFRFFVLMDLHRASRWILGQKLPDKELNSNWILLLFLDSCKGANLFWCNSFNLAKRCRILKELKSIISQKEVKKESASSGNRTRAARVAGEHSTTEPLYQKYSKYFESLVLRYFKVL